jgi:PAS domain S-box-containing protein
MSTQKYTILIVDDSRTIRMLLRNALESAGFATREADSGEAALEQTTQELPDAVLLDVEMPGMSGFETCVELRKMPGGEYLPIMIITSLDDINSINKAYEVGATDFATKPVSWDLIGHRARYMIRASQAIQEVSRTKVRLSNAQQVAQLGSWEWDVKASTFFWSEELYFLTKTSMSKPRTVEKHLLDIVHPDDKDELEKKLKVCIQDKKLYHAEYRIILPSGEVRFLHEKTDALTDAAGNVEIILGVIQDITALKSAEQQVIKLNRELEQKVVQRTQQLNQTNESLQQTLDQLQTTQTHLVESEKMAALGGLVAGVAHEVNTPIGVSITAVTHLQDAFGKITKTYHDNTMKRSDMEKFLSTSEESIRITLTNLNRSSDLIESFKQVSADNTDEQRREFDTKEYLQEIITSLQPMLNKTSLKISLVAPDDIIIDNYPGILFQIITALVKNSITHGYAKDAVGNLKVTLEADKRNITLRYEDDGKGITSENQKRIFEPFFTTARGAGNVGLGLHIIYNRIVQTLGGNIHVDSTPGRGTTFIIQFPRQAPSEKPKTAL